MGAHQVIRKALIAGKRTSIGIRPVLFTVAFFLLTDLAQAHSRPAVCARIVSLAPSVTEVLYALELEENLYGVTRYCRYPPEAMKKLNVGGFLDPNNEIILGLKPSLVVTLREQEVERRFLDRLGVTTREVDHKSIEGVLNSITVLGDLCGASARGSALRGELEARVETIRRARASLPRERVLVAIGGNAQDGVLSNLFVSGKDGYYDQMLSIVGGENVYQGVTASLPSVSKEGLIALNPEVIIQIGSENDGVRIAPEAILKAWRGLEMIKAVKTGRIHVLTQDFASIPGPRFIALVEEFAKIVHPEALK